MKPIPRKVRWSDPERRALVDRAAQLLAEQPTLSMLALLREAQHVLSADRRRRVHSLSYVPWFEEEVAKAVQRRSQPAFAQHFEAAHSDSQKIIENQEVYTAKLQEMILSNERCAHELQVLSATITRLMDENAQGRERLVRAMDNLTATIQQACSVFGPLARPKQSDRHQPPEIQPGS